VTKVEHGVVPAGVAEAGRAAFAPLVRALAAVGLSPNTVTVLGVVVSVTGAVALVAYGPLLGLVVLALGAAADTLDGQLARATGRVSVFGGFLDSTLDRISDAAPLLAAVLVAVTDRDLALAGAALLALLAGFLVPYTRAKAEALGRNATVGLAPREARNVLVLIGIALWWLTGQRAVFTIAIAITALLAWITVVQRIAHVSRQGDRGE
jgi:CDP-diacylglycerol--glycerol-3-phosphate 3-phosphatidyltransferase